MEDDPRIGLSALSYLPAMSQVLFISVPLWQTLLAVLLSIFTGVLIGRAGRPRLERASNPGTVDGGQAQDPHSPGISTEISLATHVFQPYTVTEDRADTMMHPATVMVPGATARSAAAPAPAPNGPVSPALPQSPAAAPSGRTVPFTGMMPAALTETGSDAAPDTASHAALQTLPHAEPQTAPNAFPDTATDAMTHPAASPATRPDLAGQGASAGPFSRSDRLPPVMPTPLSMASADAGSSSPDTASRPSMPHRTDGNELEAALKDNRRLKGELARHRQLLAAAGERVREAITRERANSERLRAAWLAEQSQASEKGRLIRLGQEHLDSRSRLARQFDAHMRHRAALLAALEATLKRTRHAQSISEAKATELRRELRQLRQQRSLSVDG